MGGGSSRGSGASGNDTEDEEAANQALAEHVLEVHQEATEHNAARQMLRHSLSKKRLEVRLRKRKNGALAMKNDSSGDEEAGLRNGRSPSGSSGRPSYGADESPSFHLGHDANFAGGSRRHSGRKKRGKKKKKASRDRSDGSDSEGDSQSVGDDEWDDRDSEDEDRPDADSRSGDSDAVASSAAAAVSSALGLIPSKKRRKHKKRKKHKKNRSAWPSGMSNMGVTIRFLQQILGRAKPDMNANNVCEIVVRPDTGITEAPYTDLLVKENRCDYHGNSFVGVATHFVSYVRSDPFEKLISALDVFVNLSGANPGRVFFWIDIFSLNQHSADSNVTQDWLTTSLPTAIG